MNTEISTEDMTFEQAIGRLEEIVGELEDGSQSLEASLACYEEGVKLAQFCLKRLEAAELRVQELKPEA